MNNNNRIQYYNNRKLLIANADPFFDFAFLTLDVATPMEFAKAPFNAFFAQQVVAATTTQ
jgi:hypothetical protein